MYDYFFRLFKELVCTHSFVASTLQTVLPNDIFKH